ncbi:MAG: hypothetical protein ACQET3_13005, partial [Promethearchaeati archaeon]
ESPGIRDDEDFIRDFVIYSKLRMTMRTCIRIRQNFTFTSFDTVFDQALVLTRCLVERKKGNGADY